MSALSQAIGTASSSPRALLGWGLAALATAAMTAGLGPWAVPAAGLAVLAAFVVPDLRVAFLLLVCFLPSLGDPDTARYLPLLFITFHGLALAAWVYRVLRAPDQVYLHLPLTFAFLAYVLVICISLLGSVDISWLPTPGGWLMGPSRTVWEPLLATAILPIAMAAVRTEVQLKAVLWTFTLSSVVYGLSLFVTGFEIEAGGTIGRQFGLFSDASPAASHLLCAAILAASLIPGSTWRGRLFLVLAIGLFLFTQSLTSSRANMIATAVVVVVWLATEIGVGRTAWYLVAVAGTVLVFLPVLPGGMATHIRQITTAFLLEPSAVATFPGRLQDIRLGVDLYWAGPPFGVGLGKHLFTAPHLLHDYYVTVLVETGLTGLVCFLAIMTIAVVSGIRVVARCRRLGLSSAARMTKGLVLAMTAMLVVLLGEPGLQGNLRPIWLFVGLIGAMTRVVTYRAQDQGRES